MKFAINRTTRYFSASLLWLFFVCCASVLLGACANEPSGMSRGFEPTPTQNPEVGGATPIATISAVIGGCEIGSGVDCPNTDFSDQDLSEVSSGRGAGLGARSSGRDATDLSKSNLRASDFSNANLAGILLNESDLRDAKFHMANLAKAILFDADASAADFTQASLESGRFEGSNLSGADFTGANMKGADLSEANLTDAVLRDVVLSGSFLTDANLTGADLTGANLIFADLDGAILDGATLCNTKMADGKINNESCP